MRAGTRCNRLGFAVQRQSAPCLFRPRPNQRRHRAHPADLDAAPCLGLSNSSLSAPQPDSADEASDLWPDFGGFDPEDSDKMFEGASDDSMDMTPSVPYLEGLSACETVVQVAELVRTLILPPPTPPQSCKRCRPLTVRPALHKKIRLCAYGRPPAAPSSPNVESH